MSGKFLSMDYKVISMNREIQYEKFFTMSVKDTLTEQQVALYVKPLYAAEGFHKVYETTKKKKMLPYVASMLSKANIDKLNWESVLENYQKRNAIVRQQLSNVYAVMAEVGVKKMFISENYGALLSSGRDIGLFASGDCDSCADISEKSKIDKVFEKLGYTREDRYSGKMLCTSSYYNSKLLPDDFYFGICWEPLSRLKLPCFINMDDFVDWDNLRILDGYAIKMPSAEALLYICLMHITLHSFHRAPAIRMYADILNSCYRGDVDWNKVYEWAKRDHTVTRMMISAILANKLTDLTIPAFVKAYENDKRVKRVLSYAYNTENGCLNSEPGRIGVYNIEISCNDRNPIKGLFEMLYPGSQWLRAHYGHNTFFSILLHIKNLL